MILHIHFVPMQTFLRSTKQKGIVNIFLSYLVIMAFYFKQISMNTNSQIDTSWQCKATNSGLVLSRNVSNWSNHIGISRFVSSKTDPTFAVTKTVFTVDGVTLDRWALFVDGFELCMAIPLSFSLMASIAAKQLIRPIKFN